MKRKFVPVILGGIMCCAMLAACTPTGTAHSHEFSSEWEHDETNHWHECECGETSDTAAHTVGEWVVDEDATHFKAGSRHRECTVCEYRTDEETIPVIEHVYDREIVKTEYLKTAATEQSAAVYYKSCECGAFDDGENAATFTYGDPLEPSHSHLWALTWTSDGSKHWHACTVSGCTARNGEADHSDFEYTDNGDGTHEKACGICEKVTASDEACTLGEFVTSDADKHYKECSVCHGHSEEAPHDSDASFVKDSGAETHSKTCSCGRVLATENCAYDIRHDAQKHWRECGGCHDVKDESAHAAVDVTLHYDEANDSGKHWKLCSCGEHVDETAHAYTEENHDAKYIKTAATAESAAVYYKSCECGAFDSGENAETFTYGDPLGEDHKHTWALTWTSDGTTHWHACTTQGCDGRNDEASHSDFTYTDNGDGTHKKACGICEKVTVSDEACTLGEWVTSDADKHYKECSVCHGHSEEGAHGGDFAIDGDNHSKTCSACGKELVAQSPHTYGDWIETQAATPDRDGSREHSCTVCGHKQTEVIPMTAERGFGDHYYELQTSNDGETLYTATGTDTADGYKIVITESHGEFWRIKFARSFGTEAGKIYELTYVFTSTVAGKVKIEMSSGAAAFYGDGDLDVTVGENTVVGRFVAAQTDNGLTYTNLQLGNLLNGTCEPGNTDIVIKEVILREISADNKLTAFTRDDKTDADVLDSAKSAVEFDNGKITATLNSDATTEPYHARVCLQTGYNVEAGKTYIAVAKIGDIGGNFNLLFHKGTEFNGDFEGIYNDVIKGNTTYLRRFTADADHELNIWLEIGKIGNGNSVVINEISIIEIGSIGDGNARVTILRTLPEQSEAKTPAPEVVLPDNEQ